MVSILTNLLTTLTYNQVFQIRSYPWCLSWLFSKKVYIIKLDQCLSLGGEGRGGREEGVGEQGIINGDRCFLFVALLESLCAIFQAI